jgi:hypothetical protein
MSSSSRAQILCYNPACQLGPFFDRTQLARHVSHSPACRVYVLHGAPSRRQSALPRRGSAPALETQEDFGRRSGSRNVHLEEVPDEGDPPSRPPPMGAPTPTASMSLNASVLTHHSRILIGPSETRAYGKPIAHFKTPFQQLFEEQAKKGLTPFGVFKNSKDWGLAEFLVRSGLSEEKIEEYLKLEMVSVVMLVRVRPVLTISSRKITRPTSEIQAISSTKK